MLNKIRRYELHQVGYNFAVTQEFLSLLEMSSLLWTPRLSAPAALYH